MLAMVLDVVPDSWRQLCMHNLSSHPYHSTAWVDQCCKQHISTSGCTTAPFAGVASDVHQGHNHHCALDTVKVQTSTDVSPDVAASRVQVVTIHKCLLSFDAGEESARTRWLGLVPGHLQMTEWVYEEDYGYIGGHGDIASFTLEARPGLK